MVHLFSGDYMDFKEGLKSTESIMRKRLRTRLEDAFDVNYTVAQICIDSMEAFEEQLLTPFLQSPGIYYRGERICAPERRLIPTLLRREDITKKEPNRLYTYIDSRTLFDFYSGREAFISVYTALHGKPDPGRMYKMLAFAQHYLDISPFIDFSASLYVALSFAMKGRTEFADDIVIYTVFDIGDDDTFTNEEEVDRQLSQYSVGIVHAHSREDIPRLLAEFRNQNGTVDPKAFSSAPRMLEAFLDGVSPTAKLINIPTNDLMKYQQGVFLLLNDFCMMDTAYFTKTVRQSFVIKKYVIDKALCPHLQKLLLRNAPQYRYECLLDITEAVKG